MDAKPGHRSKTYWFNGGVILFGVAEELTPEIATWICAHRGKVLIIIGVVGMVLRRLTKGPVGKASMMLLLALVTGCAGAKLEIRPDPNPPPMKINHHTMLLDSTCGPGMSYGQHGCSVETVEEAHQHTLKVVTPLGGKVSIYSRECAYDEPPIIVAQGGVVEIPLSKMVPVGAKFCSFSLFTYWEKPKELTTEVPVHGQSGKFYLRVRGKGRKAATLAWTPQQGVIKQAKGLLYSQFRELAITARTREPVLLLIRPTQSVGSGLFTLWSEAKQIGVKSQLYSGGEIQIPRDTILGSAQMGSYILGGYAVSQDPDLYDDFYVAVDIFRHDSAKLGAEVSFTEKELCFRTENTVSLVVLSGVEKASNKTQDCFPKPTGDAVIGFFTNVGRAAYAQVRGQEVTWIQ